MEILGEFGVQPVLLLAQIINFSILLFVLHRFLYKPIMKVLNERRDKVETSMKQAEEIQKKLDETESRQKDIIGQAESESSKIIGEAKEAGKKLQEETLLETDRRVNESFEKNKETLKLEREKMITEVKTDMADLVAETTKKILGKYVASKDNEELVKKTLKDLES